MNKKNKWKNFANLTTLIGGFILLNSFTYNVKTAVMKPEQSYKKDSTLLQKDNAKKITDSKIDTVVLKDIVHGNIKPVYQEENKKATKTVTNLSEIETSKSKNKYFNSEGYVAKQDISFQFEKEANKDIADNKIEKSIKDLKKEIDFDNKNIPAKVSLAKQYLKKNRFKMGIKTIDEVLKEDSSYSELLIMKAEALYDLGKSNESYSLVKKLIENGDSSPINLNLLALSGYEIGKTSKKDALKYFEKAFKLETDVAKKAQFGRDYADFLYDNKMKIKAENIYRTSDKLYESLNKK